MTDELIILKNIVDGAEGFFKFEDGYRNMSVYAKGKEDKKYWCIADNDFYFGEIDKKGYCRVVSPCGRKPANCGVFSVSEDNATLEMFFGNLTPLREGIEKYVKKRVASQEKSSVSEAVKELNEEIEVKNEIDAEKETAKTNEELVEEESIEEESVVQEIQEFIGQNEKAPETFWECNQKFFLEALDKNEPEEILNEFIPGSKWVKMNEEDSEYVLGVIFDENEEPMYLCYGFNLPWSEEPPEKLEGYCQWIPVDCAEPHEKGYWVIYVNAKTGERIK